MKLDCLDGRADHSCLIFEKPWRVAGGLMVLEGRSWAHLNGCGD